MLDDSGELAALVQLRDDNRPSPSEEALDPQIGHGQQDLGEQSRYLEADLLRAGHRLLHRPKRATPAHNSDGRLVITPLLDHIGPQCQLLTGDIDLAASLVHHFRVHFGCVVRISFLVVL